MQTPAWSSSPARRAPERKAQVAAVLQDIRQVETVVKDLIELARPANCQPHAMARLNDVVRTSSASWRHS